MNSVMKGKHEKYISFKGSYDVMNKKNNAVLKNGMIRQYNSARGVDDRRFNQLKNFMCVVIVVFVALFFLILLHFFSGHIKRSFGVIIHSLSI